MPRSIDPRNYGPFYDKLGELMDLGEHDIKLKMSGRLAIYHRNNFYAYINAWKHTCQRIPTDKTIPPDRREHLLEQALRREDVLRKYLVVITPDPNQQDILDTEVELRFLLRGMDERQLDQVAQLNAMLAKSVGIGLDDMKDKLNPTNYKAIDSATLHSDDSPIKHLFAGVTTKVDEGMTDELADEILHADPPDHTDMSDLITESYQGKPPAPSRQEYIDMMTKPLKEQRKEEKSKKTS